METAASEIRRRARYHALRGGPPANLAHGMARPRRYLVLMFQLAVIGFLAARGFPGGRLLAHAGICVFYLLFCRHPSPPVTVRAKLRMLVTALVAYGAWLANTGGLASPLVPLGLGLLLPALLILESRRQKALFIGGALAILLAVASLSLTPLSGLVPPLAPHEGRCSPEYLVIAMAAILVTAKMVSGFWAWMTTAYDQVAVELGTRREELCSVGEDRTRELEGAAAHLAHELKNPLASIRCLSAHLARGAADPKTAARLGVVSAEAERLAAIVDGFMSLSRGLGDLSLAPTRPYDVAGGLKLLLDVRAQEAGVALEVVGHPEVEVDADAKKIHRAMFYLVMNAMQASSAGQKVTVDIGPACLMTGKTRIKIIDRGEGMSSAVLQRLKKPYFTTREGGTGLGVVVASALIEQHGGRLEYESAPGRGTTATIDLPRRPPAGSTAQLIPDSLRGRAPDPA
jgi:signal transduction histidine kinase